MQLKKMKKNRIKVIFLTEVKKMTKKNCGIMILNILL